MSQTIPLLDHLQSLGIQGRLRGRRFPERERLDQGGCRTLRGFRLFSPCGSGVQYFCFDAGLDHQHLYFRRES